MHSRAAARFPQFLALPVDEFVGESRHFVYLAQCLEDAGTVYADGACLDVAVREAAGQRLDVAVENDADELPGAVKRRAAGVSADDVAGADEVEWRGQIESGFFLDPSFGQLEITLVP